jgi:aryl-alcohol dehydrogenase-like predicted oxidoreductase
MTFGEEWGWGSSKEESRGIYDRFRDLGGNFVDTANLYTNGASELFLGEFMQGHRDQVVLATKYTNAVPGKDPNAAGNHRKSMMTAVEASLKRLRTDYIDLYWMHIWDRLTPAEEVMRGFDDLVRQGKVLCGASRLVSVRRIANRVQPLGKDPRAELLPMAADFGLSATWQAVC